MSEKHDSLLQDQNLMTRQAMSLYYFKSYSFSPPFDSDHHHLIYYSPFHSLHFQVKTSRPHH